MSSNKRREVRQKVTIPAKILTGGSHVCGFGIVRNISRQGCMVVGRDFRDIPESFDLAISGNPSPMPCQAVWRTDHALGVKFTDGATVDPVVWRLFKAKSGNTPSEKAPQPADHSKQSLRTMSDIASLQDRLSEVVAAGDPLPKDLIGSASIALSDTLRSGSLESWLQAVRTHSSYTYRHCMIVSGLVVSFAQKLRFCEADIQRMAAGALLHDIGKVMIPLEILDKPGKLTDEEYAEIKNHPVYGAQIMRDDGQFSAEVVDLTLHHHELLDGSGYPDGLSGTQISDPVRLLTIADIFSALIDKRSYKEAMSAETAYAILRDMDGKLEGALVNAFEPIALAARTEAAANCSLASNGAA